MLIQAPNLASLSSLQICQIKIIVLFNLLFCRLSDACGFYSSVHSLGVW